jgi:HTH-type transcriptional regulator/antitoxin HigA
MASTIKTSTAFEPDWVSPPGDTLLEIIELKGITQKELADRAGVTSKHVNTIVKGTAPITPDMAIRLERVTGTSAKFWNAREADYQTRKAKIKAREQLLKER